MNDMPESIWAEPKGTWDETQIYVRGRVQSVEYVRKDIAEAVEEQKNLSHTCAVYEGDIRSAEESIKKDRPMLRKYQRELREANEKLRRLREESPF